MRLELESMNSSVMDKERRGGAATHIQTIELILCVFFAPVLKQIQFSRNIDYWMFFWPKI